HKHAGAITLVARNGKIADMATFGYRDLETRAPMTADTIFRIYSMSKIITTVAALILFEEGRYALDDPVTDYIPELRSLKVINPGGGEHADFARLKRPITIRHLLTHTAGFTYDFTTPDQLKPYWAKADIWNENVDFKEFIRRISFVPWHINRARNSRTASTPTCSAILCRSSPACLSSNFSRSAFSIR